MLSSLLLSSVSDLRCSRSELYAGVKPGSQKTCYFQECGENKMSKDN